MNSKKKMQLIRVHQNRINTKLNDFDQPILNIIGDFCADGDTELDEIGFTSLQQNSVASPIALNRTLSSKMAFETQSLDSSKNFSGIRPLTVSLTPQPNKSNAGIEVER